MKRILLLSLLPLFLVSSSGLSQEPVIEWQKSLGGTGSDRAFSIQQTSDEGYIVVGDSYSNDGDVTGNHGMSDYWVTKLDVSGNITWNKSLGGSQIDWANSIQQTTDGGYIVAGISTSNDGDVTGYLGGSDYWIVKLDEIGNIIWQKSLGGSGNDQAQSIQQTTDGGYIVAGYSRSNDGDVTGNNGEEDAWIVKLDPTGNIEWQKSLGGTKNEFTTSIQQTTDGGYIVAGYSRSNDGDLTVNNGQEDAWIVKLDEIGNIIWQKSLGGSENDQAQSIQQTTDGGYIIAGYSDSNDGDVTGNNGGNDAWVVKLDISGSITWQKSLGGTGDDRGYSIQQTTDEGYIVAGYSDSDNGDVTGNNGGFDYWIVKLDASGNITWQKSIGGTETDETYSIKQTTDEGYIVAGGSLSNDGDVTGNNGGFDFWVVKLSPETSSVKENKMFKISAYPNPTTKTFTMFSDYFINSAFKIIDAQGKEVQTGNMNGKEQIIEISYLSKGVYSVVFDNSELPILSVIKE